MAVPTYVGLTPGGGTISTGLVTRAWPAHASGDVMICYLQYGNNAAPAVPTCTGTTFYPVPDSPFLGLNPISGLDTDDINLAVYFGYATSAAMPSVSFNGSSWYRQNSYVFRDTGGSGSTYPFNMVSTPVYQPDDTINTVTYPNITTTSADTLVLLYAACATPPAVNGNPNFQGTYTNANLSSLTTIVNFGHTAVQGSGLMLITGTKTTAGNVGAGSGITTIPNSTNLTYVIALGGTPYIPITEKYFKGTSGNVYRLVGTKLLNLSTGEITPVANHTKFMINLSNGKRMYKFATGGLVDV